MLPSIMKYGLNIKLIKFSEILSYKLSNKYNIYYNTIYNFSFINIIEQKSLKSV